MLNFLDIEKVFARARAQGHSRVELYLERDSVTTLRFEGKHYRTDKTRSSGSHLICGNEEGVKTYYFSDLCPESISEVLGPEEKGLFTVDPRVPDSGFARENHEKLLSLSRKYEAFCPDFSMEYTQRRRDFAIVNSLGETSLSNDEQLQLNASFSLGDQQFSQHDHQTEIERFWKSSFNENQLLEKLKARFETQAKWPLPEGEVPILISSRALSKILLHLVRGLEADNLLLSRSFLNNENPSRKFCFSLLECPRKDQKDQEGEKTKQFALIQEGKFTGLATNQSVAKELELPRTGHGRRMSYRCKPQIALYHSILVPKVTTPFTFQSLQKAIWIEDLEIDFFNSKTTFCKLHIPRSKLIHHGDFGENLEAWNWEISLLDLLESVSEFSNQETLHGFSTLKDSSVLPTQITCPDALSTGLPLPGSVPQAYYWD